MDDHAPFGSPAYWALLGLLVFSRGMDFLSTWIATPNLVLEGNPISRKLGWKGGLLVNAALCGLFAGWTVPAIIISTTSVLVAARNFQSAWLMRSLGEEPYRAWHVARLRQTNGGLYLLCLFAQTLLVAGIGVALVYFSGWQQQVTWSIGLGIVAYAVAVLIYTLLSLWRLRRDSV